MPDRNHLLQSLLRAVEFVQVASGRAAHGLSAQTDLFGEIDGFDSLNALEVIVEVGAEIGIDIPDKVLRPTTEWGTLAIGTLADRILALVEDTADVEEAAGV